MTVKGRGGAPVLIDQNADRIFMIQFDRFSVMLAVGIHSVGRQFADMPTISALKKYAVSLMWRAMASESSVRGA